MMMGDAHVALPAASNALPKTGIIPAPSAPRWRRRCSATSLSDVPNASPCLVESHFLVDLDIALEYENLPDRAWTSPHLGNKFLHQVADDETNTSVEVGNGVDKNSIRLSCRRLR